MLVILVAAAVAFVLGFLWHGPLFGKTWMRLAGVRPTGNEKFTDMIPQMLLNYLANVVTATVMAGAFWIAFSSPLMGEATWFRGAIVAGWLWLGFNATSSSMDVIWMGRSKKLWLFELSSSLVSLAAMGAVLAVWR